VSNLDLQKLEVDDSTRIVIHVIEVEENHFSLITYHFKIFIDFLSCLNYIKHRINQIASEKLKEKCFNISVWKKTR